jgi:tight adherence protein C
MDAVGVLVLLVGALFTAGMVMVVRQILPTTPALGPALQRLHPPAATTRPGQRALPGPVGLIPVPRAALTLLGRTDRDYYISIGTAAVLGLLTPTVVTLILLAGHIHLPLALPAAAGLAVAAFFVYTAHREMLTKAKRAAVEFRYVIAIFLDLVAMERAAGQASVAALERAARVGEGHWVFGRIRQALNRAQLQLRPPWVELEELAEEIQVPELGSLGKVMESAGVQGAQVHDTLRASADSLRNQLRVADLAEAEALNTYMNAPGALMLLVITVFFLYPLLAPLTSP